MSGSVLKRRDSDVIGAIKIRLADLEGMDATEQLRFMREWFLENYEDPVHSLPYIGREGGYIWIFGGPYDAHEELHEKFGGLVPEEVIDSLGDELATECLEWAAQIDPSDDDPFGFEDAGEPEEHFDEYRQAMDGNRALLDMDVPDSLRGTFYGMVFVNLVTIMETYLADTFIRLVTHSDKHMRRFVATTPEFQERKLSLAEIYESLDKIAETTRKYLETVVWHRLEVVKNMYHDTLGVSFPGQMRNLFSAVKVRHALVHRNGKMEEEYVEITEEGIRELAGEIDDLIRSINEQVANLSDDEEYPLSVGPLSVSW